MTVRVVLSVNSLNNSHLVGLLLGTQESCPHILAVSCLLLDFLDMQPVNRKDRQLHGAPGH